LRLLIHDTLATVPVVEPIRQGWVDTGDLEVVFDAALDAALVGPDDVALIPAGELCFLHGRVRVVPDFGVIADSEGPVGLRVPVRPDEVERTAVRLIDVSITGELLARATLRPFFGIEATGWSRDDVADAQAVVIEGEATLLEPEGGFAEDLCRAWFIMTGQAVVLHVLVAPAGTEREALGPVLAVLAATQGVSRNRRRDMRRPVAERAGVTVERINAFYERLFFALERDDVDSLRRMLREGTAGSPYPTPGLLDVLPFAAAEPEPEEDPTFADVGDFDDEAEDVEFPAIPAEEDDADGDDDPATDRSRD
jgi:predicted solute-binding protein